jgi:hypothetical protein
MDYVTREGARLRLSAERDFSLLTFGVVLCVGLATALVAIVEIISYVIGV